MKVFKMRHKNLLSAIANDLGVTESYIQGIVNSANKLYKVYTVPKRNGGKRVIHHPAPRLKVIQRWLNRNIFRHMSVSPIATAYIKNKGIYCNTLPHCEQYYILKTDFNNFFPSIKSDDLFNMIEKNFPIDDNDKSLIRRICFLNDRLSIGAPSSPVISNIIMFDIDMNLLFYCKSRSITITRYADDITASCNNRDILLAFHEYAKSLLFDIDSPQLTINEKKFSIIGKANTKIVTGLTITSDGRVSLGRSKKRELRALAHKRSVGTLSDELQNYLDGWFSYGSSIEPDFFRSLKDKFGA
ncbi:MAG: retron St85 family RNA-directed DNA polymerase [Oceanicaulis sp.]|nr:retron St85 family RNA-directed DNA polymerase [Oceanicaulis sp.]